MATTGERLVELSTLTTGTALEHFLNIAVAGPVYDEAIDVELLDPPDLTVSSEMVANVEMVDPVIEVTMDQVDHTVELDSPEIEVELE